MSRTYQLGLSIAVILATACSTPRKPQHFRLLFSATTDAGEPVGGVAVRANGLDLGTTGPGGGLAMELYALDGKVLQVSANCPVGFRSPTEDTIVRLQRVYAAEDDGELTVSLECRPAIRHAAVLVRAPNRPNLPITLHGNEIAKTDENGLAHLLLSLSPGTRFQIGIDTSANPYLRPRNPVSTFVLEDLDQVFVFDQEFAEQRPKKRKKVHKPPPPIKEIESIDKKRWQ